MSIALLSISLCLTTQLKLNMFIYDIENHYQYMKLLKLIFFTCLFLISSMVSFANIPDDSPRFVVHILDYLAGDYGLSVKNGKIINIIEYKEQVEFIEAALKTNKIHPLQSQLLLLKTLIQNKAAATEVTKLARKIQSEMIQITRLTVSPVYWPNLDNGAKIFKKNCTMCHGSAGDGKGPLSPGLSPKPTNFLDEDHMKQISPFQAFNTIRLGIPGTPMTPFHNLSDKEVWDLAFYVISLHCNSLRYDSPSKEEKGDVHVPEASLSQVSSQSDEKLLKILSGTPDEKKKKLTFLRLHSEKRESNQFMMLAKSSLQEALEYYQKGDIEFSKKKALVAYLDGVEPIEPKLKANDPKAVSDLELQMLLFRGAIKSKKSVEEVRVAFQSANEALEHAQTILEKGPASPWMTYIMTLGIILREALEAFLIILAFLGILRVSPSREAARWVHGGWIFALLVGGVTWIFSGWLMAMSGAEREFLEAMTSFIAVFVLLYVGFWLHRQIQIDRWKAFIQDRIHRLLERKNFIGLFFISFIAVFREVFETVLFLRAIWIESGGMAKTAMAIGFLSSMVLVFVLAFFILKYSARLPIRKLFEMSAGILVGLSVILIGKGLHALQETGILSVTAAPLSFHVDILGIYPTMETVLSQIIIVSLCVGFWIYEKRKNLASI